MAGSPAGPIDEPGIERRPTADGSREYAVLAPIAREGGESSILLAVRPDRPGDAYAGDICFPGGAREPQDANLLACALREFEEEFGVPARAVEVVASLPLHATRVGHRVKPWAGVVRAPFALRPSPAEVERIVRLPVAELEGLRGVPFLEGVDVEGARLWGLTLRILQGFLDDPAFRAAAF